MAHSALRLAAASITLFFAFPLHAQTGSSTTVTTPPPVSPIDPNLNVSPTGGGGSTTPPPTTARATTPPILFGISGGGSVELGQKVTLQVSLSGVVTDPELTYQWRRNGTDLSAATAATYVIEATTAADTATYTIAVTNSAGTSVATTDVTVKAAAAPLITTQPRTTTASAGQTVTFSFVATGSFPRTYQWRKDGTPLPGATDATLTLNAITTAQAGAYSVALANALGAATSSPASLTVNAATPPIVSSGYPFDVTATQGSSATLSSSLNSGSSPFTYQWLKNGVAIPGATNSSLAFTAVALADAGRYSFTVTNLVGSATSREATITVSPPTPVTIFSITSSQSLFVGQALNLSVSTGGSAPLTYQWRKDGVAIADATNSSFSISSTVVADSGSYSVIVTNPAGSATSSSTAVTINPPTAPTITTQPANQTVTYHGSISLSVQVTGSPPFTFAWRKDGAATGAGSTSTGSTSSNYSLSTATPAHSGSYTVVITNAAGSITSNAATVTVSAATVPTITTQPLDRLVAAGLSATFSASFSSTGTGSLTAQWFKDGIPLSGANSSSYNISAAKDTDAGTYTIVVTGAAGSVTSNPAKLTVLPPAPPVVSSWPTSRTATLGNSASFNVNTPGGTGPFTYQWFKEGALIGGATGGTLSFPSVTENDLASYTVTVTNDGGVVASPAFQLSLSGTPVAAPWLSVRKLGNIAYFLATVPARIERYDLAAERWLPTVILSETQVPTAFLPQPEGVYLAYGRTLVRRSPDLATETPLVNVASNLTLLFALDDFLYYNASATSPGSSATISIASLRRSTLAAGPSSSAALAETALAPALRRVFGAATLDGRNPPTGLIVGSDGRLTPIRMPPSYDFYVYYNQIASGNRHFVFPNEDVFANNAGALFRTADLTYAGSLGAAFNDLVFLGDGAPVVLRDRTLHLLNGTSYLESGRATLPLRGTSAVALENSIFVFGPPPAAGSAFAVAKVLRSAFASAVLPPVTVTPAERFSVDAVFAGQDGVVGVFSRSKQAVLRWSSSSRAFLTPIPLRAQPAFFSQISGSTRALLAYDDGTLTELPVRAGSAFERQIGTVTNRVLALTDLSDQVLANVRDMESSGNHRLLLDANGRLSNATFTNSNSPFGVAWLASTRRLYSTDSLSSGTLRYETVSPAGVISAVPNATTVPFIPPLHFNPESTLMATGNGRVLNADLAQVGVLANNILDAAWLPGGLYTLRTGTNGEAEIQRWARVTYLPNGTLSLRGTPQRLLAISDSQLVAVTLIQGFLSFTVLNADLSLALPAGAADLSGTYFGSLGTAGDFALHLRADRTGVLLVHAAAPRTELVAAHVALGSDGSFFVNARDLATGGTRLVQGTISATGLSGSIPSLNLTLAGTKSSPGSATAGYFATPALNGSNGSAYAIVAPDGRALLLAQSGTALDGGTATLDSAGRLALSTTDGTRFTAALSTAGSLTATAEAGRFATTTTFAGLRDDLPRTDRLANISTRGRVGPGDDLMIAGFVLSGAAPRPVLIRAIGPSLGAFGVPGTLADPRLTLYRGSAKLAENDNWSTWTNATDLATTTTRLGGFALGASSADSALLLTLDPGAYTAQVGAPDGAASGTALVEVYDAGSTPTPGAPAPRLINIATRGRLNAADESLIAGIVVTGNAPKLILVRAIGPGLAAFGVPGTLPDPVLALTGPTGTLATNDDWSTPAASAATPADLAAAAVSVGAFALPANSRDACLLLTLAPGNYTAQVTGKNGSTGIALVEIYEISN